MTAPRPPGPEPADAGGRYLRHTQIQGFSQDAVRKLSVLVVGAGAIGNETVKNLVLLGAGRITLVDRDRVEAHNLTRSVLLREADIGRDKATAVADHARALDPAVTVDALVGDLQDCLGPDDAAGHDVLIGALDNFEARLRVNQLALLAGRPWINAAIDARHASVESFPPSGAERSACYECGLPESVYARLAERQSCGGLMRAALAERIMPTTALTTSIAAALAVGEALRLTGCDGRGAQLPGGASRIFFDTLAGQAGRSVLAPAPVCPACGLLPSPARRLGRVRSVAELLSRFGDPDGERTYLLADRIVWHAACRQCETRPAGGSLVGRRAAGLSDALTWCARCAAPSVEFDIRDQAQGRELRDHFGSGLPETAWILEGDAIVGVAPAEGRRR